MPLHLAVAQDCKRSTLCFELPLGKVRAARCDRDAALLTNTETDEQQTRVGQVMHELIGPVQRPESAGVGRMRMVACVNSLGVVYEVVNRKLG